MADADCTMCEQRAGRGVRQVGTPPLLRVSDDVLILVLEKTCAIGMFLCLGQSMRRRHEEIPNRHVQWLISSRCRAHASSQ